MSSVRAHEDVPRIVEGYFGDSAAQDMQSVLYRYYLLMNLLVTASQLADEVQAAFRPRRIRRACSVRRQRSRAPALMPKPC